MVLAWWGLLTIDKVFLPAWRESDFPGGFSHACVLETSLYQYLDGDNVRSDQIAPGNLSLNDDKSPFLWVDLLGGGSAGFVPWTSSDTRNGVMGAAHLATTEKGRLAYEEAVRQLVRFVSYLKERPADQRVDHHTVKPTMPMPWGQRNV